MNLQCQLTVNSFDSGLSLNYSNGSNNNQSGIIQSNGIIVINNNRTIIMSLLDLCMRTITTNLHLFRQIILPDELTVKLIHNLIRIKKFSDEDLNRFLHVDLHTLDLS